MKMYKKEQILRAYKASVLISTSLLIYVIQFYICIYKFEFVSGID